MSDVDKINEAIDKLGHAFEEHKKTNNEVIQSKADGKAISELEEKQAKIDKDLDGILDMKKDLENQAAAIKRMGGVVGAQESAPEMDKKAYESGLKKMVKGKFDANVQLTDVERKAMQSNIDPDGGYTIMPFMGGTEAIDYDTSNVRALASVQTIGTNTYQGFFDDNRQAAGWVGEVTARPATATAEIGKFSVPVHTIYANAPVSEELLEDSSWNLESFVKEKASLEFGLTENTSFVTGDNIAQPQGFTTATAKTSNADVYTRNQVGTLDAASATVVTGDEIISTRALLKSSYRSNAYWAFNRSTESAIRKLVNGSGNYLWQPSFTAGEPDQLIGQRIAIMEDMPDQATGAVAIALADFRRTYLIVDRVGMSVLRDPFTNKPYINFYMRKRVGGAIKNFDSIKYLRQA